MKKLIIEPAGWPCKLRECPPGLFVSDMDTLCVKTDYPEVNCDTGKVRSIAYLQSGDYFAGGGSLTVEQREELIVQPVRAVWVEEEE